MLSRIVPILVSACLLAGCGTIARPTYVATDLLQPDPLASDRFQAGDRRAAESWVTGAGGAGADGVFNMLAISGGGANGAFGAGLLVGWTQSGQRPEFDIVTGVSTGALTAPFAFLGPAWDARLTQAYTGHEAARVLSDMNLLFFAAPSLYSSRPLERLVASYVDEALIEAVAREHRNGRRLLVATTNLDSQETVIWDLGAVAAAGGPEAIGRFRDVLVASASLPGVFPPKLITTWRGGTPVVEAHVDGGLATPFFTSSEGLTDWVSPNAHPDNPGRLFAIINGKTAPNFAFAHTGAVAVLSRSLNVMGKAQLRSQLALSRRWAANNHSRFAYAEIPVAADEGVFRFDLANRRQLFLLGENLARQGQAWRDDLH